MDGMRGARLQSMTEQIEADVLLYWVLCRNQEWCRCASDMMAWTGGDTGAVMGKRLLKTEFVWIRCWMNKSGSDKRDDCFASCFAGKAIVFQWVGACYYCYELNGRFYFYCLACRAQDSYFYFMRRIFYCFDNYIANAMPISENKIKSLNINGLWIFERGGANCVPLKCYRWWR